jgi:hypothetical protein
MTAPEAARVVSAGGPLEGPRLRRRRVGRDVVSVVGAVMVHPSLWWAAVSAMARLSRRGWWRRPPFLPVPGDAYWDFRLVTAFGGTGADAVMSRDDVVAYLRWCQRARPHRG